MVRRLEVITDRSFEMTIPNRDSKIAVNCLRQSMKLSLKVKISFSIADDKAKDEWSMFLWVLDVLGKLFRQKLFVVIVIHSDECAINWKSGYIFLTICIVDRVAAH